MVIIIKKKKYRERDGEKSQCLGFLKKKKWDPYLNKKTAMMKKKKNSTTVPISRWEFYFIVLHQCVHKHTQASKSLCMPAHTHTRVCACQHTCTKARCTCMHTSTCTHTQCLMCLHTYAKISALHQKRHGLLSVKMHADFIFPPSSIDTKCQPKYM